MSRLAATPKLVFVEQPAMGVHIWNVADLRKASL